MALEIDMQDPGTRALLGDVGERRAASGKPERELVHIAGDMDTGITTSYQIDRGKREVIVTYKDFVLTVDVYRIEGEPLKVHLICPKCRHALSVSSERKAIDYDERAGDPAKGGRLSIEPFQCTWENADAGDHKQGIVSGGMTLCKWRVGIENNVARDA